MNNRKIENSVRNLVTLYTVVMGAALSLALTRMIDAEKGLSSLTFAASLLFIGFVATLLPFFHGALRHLDDAYIEQPAPHKRNAALIVDFSLLFFHALAFVVLALLLRVPVHFAWALVALLFLDVLWGLFTHFVFPVHEGSASWKWAVINGVFVVCVVGYLVTNEIYSNDLAHPIRTAAPVAAACVLRSIVDYVWCSSFYFPG